MPTHVALVRGINVGRAKRVAMADLRALAEGLGYGDVSTVLNSGNLLFTAARGKPEGLARRIEQGMAEQLGIRARVAVLTAAEFKAVVEENTLGAVAATPTRLLVAFCLEPDRLRDVAPLARLDFRPEALAVGRRAAYLWCPEGVLASRALDAVGQKLGDSTTIRNWATVMRIKERLEAKPTQRPAR
jgi:uncharacterized protein (DUF1697 family)